MRWRDLWPGVAFAAIAYELAKRGFTLYLENFADYNAIYGAFGSAVAFLAFVYVSAIVLIIGAEMAALWPRVRAGDYDPKEGRSAPPGGGVRRFVIGLFEGDDEGPGGETGDDRAAGTKGARARGDGEREGRSRAQGAWALVQQIGIADRLIPIALGATPALPRAPQRTRPLK